MCANPLIHLPPLSCTNFYVPSSHLNYLHDKKHKLENVDSALITVCVHIAFFFNLIIIVHMESALIGVMAAEYLSMPIIVCMEGATNQIHSRMKYKGEKDELNRNTHAHTWTYTHIHTQRESYSA